MPGCLGLDAMWQLVGFFLGWLGNPGKGRALGVGTVKFTGEVLQSVKNVRYEIDMKKICLLYTSPSPRDVEESRMPSSA